jgi:hypothetical protein
MKRLRGMWYDKPFFHAHKLLHVYGLSVLNPETIMNFNMALSLHIYVFFSQIWMHNGDSIHVSVSYVKYATVSLNKLTVSHSVNTGSLYKKGTSPYDMNPLKCITHISNGFR